MLFLLLALSSSQTDLTGLIATISAIFSAVGTIFIVTTFALLRMRRARILVIKAVRERAARQKMQRERLSYRSLAASVSSRSAIVMSSTSHPTSPIHGEHDGVDYALMVDPQRAITPTPTPPSPSPSPTRPNTIPPLIQSHGSPMMSASDSLDADSERERAQQRQRRHPASDASLVAEYNTMLLYLALTQLLNAATYITSHFIHLHHTDGNENDGSPPDSHHLIVLCRFVGVAMHFSELSTCFWCACMGMELWLILVRPLRFTLAITSEAISSSAPLLARSRSSSYLSASSSANTVPLLLSSLHHRTSNCFARCIHLFYVYRHRIYFALTWGLASLIVLATLASHSMDIDIYGNTDSSWCWLRREHEELRFLSYYLFLFLSIGVTAIIYVRILRFLTTSFREEQGGNANDDPSSSPPTIRSQLVRQQRSARFRIILYPLVFILLNISAIIDRSYQMLADDSIFVLVLLHSLCSPAQGFVNAVVYGATNKRIKQVWGRLCLCGSSPSPAMIIPAHDPTSQPRMIVSVEQTYGDTGIRVGSSAVDYSAADHESYRRPSLMGRGDAVLPHITTTTVQSYTPRGSTSARRSSISTARRHIDYYSSSESSTSPSPSRHMLHDEDGLISDSYDVPDTIITTNIADEDEMSYDGTIVDTPIRSI